MDVAVALGWFQKMWAQAQVYFLYDVLSWAMAAQIVVAGVALFLAHRTTRGINTWLSRLETQCSLEPDLGAELPFLVTFKKVINSALAFFFLRIAYVFAEHFNWPRQGLYTLFVIFLALTLVRLFTESMRNRFWARILAAAIWLLAALYIFHLIDPWLHIQQHIIFQVGQVNLSLFQITRAIPVLLLLYWLTRNFSILWRAWLRVGSGLSPSVQLLLSRLGTLSLFSAVVVLILTYLGLDLTFLALFGGALGLGLGFGLQKIFANLVSGFILLADKSIKPGDVIQLGDKYGWINFLGSRYISVITRKGTEHLIPNEHLITSEVINWSYSNNLVRLEVPVGVAYNADLEKAKDLMLEAATDIKRILKEPVPSCHLSSFGDNAVNLELRVWINDPQNGLGSVKSDLQWGIWRRFREHGIEMPFPQRDVYLKSVPETMLRSGEGPKAE